MKKFIILMIVFSIFILNTDSVSADFDVSQSATFVNDTNYEIDSRVIILEQYLAKHNSPLSEYSDYFVKYADEYGLDWRLIAAISGVESTFGKHIPNNSYNAYGWANGAKAFDSWQESIYFVSKALKENYISKGADSIDEIGRIYAPPSKTWSYKVKYFMNKIHPTFLEFTI